MTSIKSQRCLCCRIKLEIEEELSLSAEEISNCKLDFELFCSILGISRRSSVSEDVTEESSQLSPFCSACSEIVFSLKELQDLLKKTKLSIQEKFDRIKQVITTASSIEDQQQELNQDELDPRFCFIRSEILQSAQRNNEQRINDAPAPATSNQIGSIHDEEVEIKMESLFFEPDDHFEATEFQFDGCDDEDDELNIQEAEFENTEIIQTINDVKESDDQHWIIPDPLAEIPSTSQSVRKEFVQRRGKKRVSMRSVDTSTERPVRQRRKNVRLNDYIDTIELKPNADKNVQHHLSRSDQLLLIKYGLDKLPQIRIEVEDLCKRTDSNDSIDPVQFEEPIKIDLHTERSRSTRFSQKPAAVDSARNIDKITENYMSENSNDVHDSEFQPTSDEGSDSSADHSESMSDSDLYLPVSNVDKSASSKTANTSKKKSRTRLQYSIQIKDGKRYYRSQEIIEEGQHLLCPYKTCNFKMVKGICETQSSNEMSQHLKENHRDDNYWCKYCQVFFKYFKQFDRHNPKCKNANTEIKRSRTRLKYSIQIKDGKRYFRSQEIIEEGQHLLCPYKTCNFKMVKGICETQSCNEMSRHFKTHHGDDNYWCKYCQVFFKYIKQFDKHNTKCKKARRKDNRYSATENDESNSDHDKSTSSKSVNTDKKSSRARLQYSIQIKYGKRYYRSQEIIEEDQHLLCPYKACDFKVPKDYCDIKSCDDLSEHLKTVHSNDNYWCNSCKIFFKYLKPLLRHKCQGYLEENQNSDTDCDEADIEANSIWKINRRQDSKDDCDNAANSSFNLNITEDSKDDCERPLKQRVKTASIEIKDGKKYYRNREIVEEGDFWLCCIETCDFKLLKNDVEMKMCDEMQIHLKTVHKDENYWCEHCKVFFKYSKQFESHKSNCNDRPKSSKADSANESDENDSDDCEPTSSKNLNIRKKSSRTRLQNSIQIKNGKRYYRSQEIIEEDQHLLCPYKVCDFKVPKDNYEINSCDDLSEHLKTVHSNDNYWCKSCKMFFKYLKSLLRHKCQGYLEENQNSDMDCDEADIEANSIWKINQRQDSNDDCDEADIKANSSFNINRTEDSKDDFENPDESLKNNQQVRLKRASIEIKDGKKYYRKREIVEEGDFWLCCIETCDFKLLKNDDETKLCDEMLIHLKTVHKDENYYCKHCKIFFKYLKQFERHKSSCKDRPKPKTVSASESDETDSDDCEPTSSKNLNIRKRGSKKRLKDSIQIMNGKRYYRSQEIIEEDQNLLCPYKACDFEMLKNSSEIQTCSFMSEHLKTVHNNNYWCKYCKVFFRCLKELKIHNCSSTGGDETEPDDPTVWKRPLLEVAKRDCENLDESLQSVERLKRAWIEIKDGKKYYRNQEIVEEGDFWMCPYKTCKLKLLKQEDEMKMCNEILSHLKTVHKDQNYLCKDCAVFFKTRRELLKHKSEHRYSVDPKIKCKVCLKPISKSNTAHQWTHLSAEERASWVASGRTDPFMRTKLERDRRRVERPFVCTICGKQCSRKQQLQFHERTHIEMSERPKLMCERCGNVYSTQRGLAMHIVRAHDPESYLGRWKVCRICDQKFVVQTHLDIHMRRHHGAEKIHKCDYPGCGAAFAATDGLSRHGVIHLEDTHPYKCELCGNGYRYKEGLRRHLRKAHGKPAGFKTNSKLPAPNPLPVMTCQFMYTCSVCEKPFALMSRLKKHMVIHDQNHTYIKSNSYDKKKNKTKRVSDRDEDSESDDCQEENSSDSNENASDSDDEEPDQQNMSDDDENDLNISSRPVENQVEVDFDVDNTFIFPM